MVATTQGARLAASLTLPLVPLTHAPSGVLKFDGDVAACPILSLNDLVMFGPMIPVNASIRSIKLGSDDLGTTGALGLGFYKIDRISDTATTFTLVSSATAIASALDVHTAAVAPTERRFSVLDHSTVTQKAWELAGLSADPGYGHLIIGAKATTATTATGNLSLSVEFVV